MNAAGLLSGVPGTSLRGLYGRAWLPLDDVIARALPGLLDPAALAAVHDEVCLGLASVPVDQHNPSQSGYDGKHVFVFLRQRVG